MERNDESVRDELNPSHEQYFDALGALVIVQDRNLRIVQSNDLVKERFGDPTGCNCYELLKRRTEKCLECPVEDAFRTGQRQKTESTVIDRHGKELPVMVYTSPIKNEAGEVIRVVELAADISDVKKLQKKLFRTQQRLRNFFDEVPCYVSVQDRDLKLVAANRLFKEDFGDEIGCHCYETYKHRTEPCLECPVVRTFEDGLSHESEEVVTSMSGDQYHVLVHTSPIRDEKGEIAQVVEMSTNITPLRDLQSQLESTGLLISSISHSIKGLLTGLDGGMYLVSSGLKQDSKERLSQGWEMVKRNVDRIRGTVLNLLYYAKEREPTWEEISAEELVNEAFSLAEGTAREHAVSLERSIDDSAGRFEGDPMAVRSLLVNLLENSLDACRVDKKKNEHRVTLSVKGSEEIVEFKVSDNGIGMDQETKEKAFSLFFSSKGMEGTGLGLFIANNIAKAHGGGITLDSQVDVGTRFTVHLPRLREIEQFDIFAD